MKKLLHTSIFCFLLIANCQLAFSQSPDWLWAKSAGGTYSDYGQSISIDASGNVLVTGSFSSDSITFGSTTLTNTGYSDIFIVKYDPSGNVLWAKSVGGTDDENGYGISTDTSGNVLVTGRFYSSSITFGSTTLTNAGSTDIFIVKYDPNGNVLWAKSAGGTNDDLGQSISTDVSGNVLVTGSFGSSSITFGSTTLTNAGGDDIFMVKYNPSGNVLWAKSAVGTYDDYGNGISTDVNGNVLVTGFFVSSSLTFGSTTLTNAGSADIFVVKYDPSGNVIWAKSAGETLTDYGNGISTDASGNVLVTGFFGSPSITFGSTTLTNAGFNDIFIVKYDPSGNVLWAKSAGGTSGDVGRSISTDVSGNVLVTGSFASSSITFGSTTLTNAGLNDIFIVKYDPSGNVLWAKSAGGIYDDYGLSIFTDASGNMLVTGIFYSPSITFGSTTLTNAGGYDFFVAKLDGVTGIEEENNTEQINVYPNPNSGKINVQMSKFENVQMKIYNLLGECIYAATDVQINPSSPEYSGQIDLSNQPKGIYLIKFNSEKGTTTKKIIIQ